MAGGAGRISGHATGTAYFSGGRTRINEGGRGEIVDLPNGTRIIPHDISQKQAVNGADIVININIQGNMIGNEQYAQYIGNVIGQKIKMAYANL